MLLFVLSMIAVFAVLLLNHALLACLHVPIFLHGLPALEILCFACELALVLVVLFGCWFIALARSSYGELCSDLQQITITELVKQA